MGTQSDRVGTFDRVVRDLQLTEHCQCVTERGSGLLGEGRDVHDFDVDVGTDLPLLTRGGSDMATPSPHVAHRPAPRLDLLGQLILVGT